MTHRRFVLAGAVLGVVGMLASAPPANAGCTLREEAAALRKSIRLATRCNDKIMKLGPTYVCKQSPPPACADTLAADTVALGYGPNNPPSSAVNRELLKDQLRCQRKIGAAMTNYVGRYLRLLLNGIPPADADLKARVRIDKLPDKCTVTVVQDVSGVVVPAVGAQCAAALPAPGGLVDAVALANCLHTLLQVWVDRNGPNPQPLKPNIVFILTDDQRWDTTDTTHSLDGVTPVMPGVRTELAAQGVEFPEAFMTTPLCCPSRASILTGSFAHRTGVYKNGGNNGGADDFNDASCVATWLQGAGYRTSLIGKYLNGYPQLWDDMTEPPYVPPGWTEWRGMKNVAFFNYVMIEPDGLGGYEEVSYGNAEADYSTDVLREKAKTFISDSVAAGEPFFLYLSFKAPHLPQIPAPRHDGMFQSIGDWRPPSYNEADVSDKPTWVQNTPPMTLAEQNDLDQVRIDQLEMLQAVDEAIGGSTTYGITGIMEHLRNLGIDDDTIVVYFADNGWHWGEHRYRAKNKPFEESIRSPMLVRYPKLVPLPRTDTRFALNVDLSPTFADLAGVGIPIAHDGESLVRVLDGTAPSWRTDFLTEGWPNNHPWATVHEGQWKYTETALPPYPTTTFELELYDLVNDPYELTNVASAPEHATRIAQMAARLRDLRPNWPTDADPNGPDPAEDE